ncbi:MAG: cytochrome family protein [Rhodospirillales bacterium]|nr:cytochrome family protein [Rhodospirillales bacterium]
MTMRTLLFALAAGSIFGAAAASAGPTGPAAPGVAQPAADPPVYRPVTSDLMNSVIQPRHIKLWLAGKDENWAYADYERHNIGGALERMAAAIPTYKGLAFADLIAAYATPQLAAVDAAIKVKDEGAFVKAYATLTEGCNGCHQAAAHEMIVIKVPDGNPFPDQEFNTPVQ